MSIGSRLRNASLYVRDTVSDVASLPRRRRKGAGASPAPKESAAPPTGSAKPPGESPTSPTESPTSPTESPTPPRETPTSPAEVIKPAPPAPPKPDPAAPSASKTEPIPGVSRPSIPARVGNTLGGVPAALGKAPAAAGRALRRVPEGSRAITRGAAKLPAWAGLVAAAIGLALIGLIILDPFGGESEPPAPVIQSGSDTGEQAEASASLGFPAFATKNTTRVGGSDAAVNAAGVALAVFPGGEQRPNAVALVPNDNWQAGVAAAVLMAPPVRAPLLVSGPGDVPAPTKDALAVLQPIGGDPSDSTQAFAIAGAAKPEGLKSVDVAGSDPAAMADAVDTLRSRLANVPEPDHIVVVSQDDPAFSMPAAGWAARSGDPVLFTGRDSVPAPTLAALKRHKGVPVFVLGPEAAVSKKAFDALGKAAPRIARVSGPNPVENAIAFARFSDATFGWNINDPGHGMVIANTSRPLDAGAAAPLSASGKYGPLLLIDNATLLPDPLRNYLLDIKPGFESDPTRAFYNHAWLIGNTDSIDISVQAQIDALLELAPVGQETAPTQGGATPAPTPAPTPSPGPTPDKAPPDVQVPPRQ